MRAQRCSEQLLDVAGLIASRMNLSQRPPEGSIYGHKRESLQERRSPLGSTVFTNITRTHLHTGTRTCGWYCKSKDCQQWKNKPIAHSLKKRRNNKNNYRSTSVSSTLFASSLQSQPFASNVHKTVDNAKEAKGEETGRRVGGGTARATGHSTCRCASRLRPQAYSLQETETDTHPCSSPFLASQLTSRHPIEVKHIEQRSIQSTNNKGINYCD